MREDVVADLGLLFYADEADDRCLPDPSATGSQVVTIAGRRDGQLGKLCAFGPGGVRAEANGIGCTIEVGGRDVAQLGMDVDICLAQCVQLQRNVLLAHYV